MGLVMDPASTIVLAVQIADTEGEKSTTRIRLTPDNAIGGVLVSDLIALIGNLLPKITAVVNGAINRIVVELPFVENPLTAATAATFQTADDKMRLSFQAPSDGDYTSLSFATPKVADFLTDTETVNNAGAMGNLIAALTAGQTDGTNTWKLVTEDGSEATNYIYGTRKWVNRKGGGRPV